MATSGPIIAIVDDDTAVRNSLKFTLEIEGFVVCIFASAQELLGSNGLTNFECLIVDQDMPGMTGLELIAALRDQGVKVPALLISGRLTPAMANQASAAEVVAIEKPFLGNGLSDSIRAAVAAKPS